MITHFLKTCEVSHHLDVSTHLDPVVEADDGPLLDVGLGKQALAGVFDAALPHLHKYRLIRVWKVRRPDMATEL